ncbi:MAG: hypothetical protein U5R14_07775 [Gemmatimonadota bacterium]|nr:hypothetical protein [Gemmatimonadota bacterium]
MRLFGSVPAALGCLALLLATLPSPGAAQEELCSGVGDVLEDEMAMVVAVRSDTVADWRTGEVRGGCRLTAAGGAKSTQAVVDQLREALEARGWSPFMEPTVSAHGSTLAYRHRGVECMLGVFPAGATENPWEEGLQEQVTPAVGEERYTVTAACVR